jgi:protein gp37
VGEFTSIGWCHHTFNAWEGCVKISPACKFCYAASLNQWLRGGQNWGPGSPRRFFGADHWKKPLAWNRKAQAAGERRRVFCSSIADIFELLGDENRDAELEMARDQLWNLILSTPWLDWLLLTKRIENAERMLPWGRYGAFATPFRNVWIGVTAEDDEYARRRIPVLRSIDAVRRFVSYEPALSPIDWTPHLAGDRHPDLVIFGDESGRERRPATLKWARDTRDACAAAGVAFYFKQWHGAGVEGERDKKGKYHLPILDGQRHAAMPGADQ